MLSKCGQEYIISRAEIMRMQKIVEWAVKQATMAKLFYGVLLCIQRGIYGV